MSVEHSTVLESQLCSYMDSESWESIFRDDLDAGLGNRLGVSYVRAQQESVELKLNGDAVLVLSQSSIGLLAISGVVWDAGLLMVDFILDRRTAELKNVLDLGCGTGVCGIAALLLGAHYVVLSDKVEPSSLEDNLSDVSKELRNRIQFISQSWELEDYDQHLLRPPISAPDAESSSIGEHAVTSPTHDDSDTGEVFSQWDMVLCSDLLYEEKAHAPLLRLLRRIQFKEAVFSYKRRHDAPEHEFFRQLSSFCDLTVVLPESIVLKNLSKSSTAGLYIVIAKPLVLSIATTGTPST